MIIKFILFLTLLLTSFKLFALPDVSLKTGLGLGAYTLRENDELEDEFEENEDAKRAFFFGLSMNTHLTFKLSNRTDLSLSFYGCAGNSNNIQVATPSGSIKGRGAVESFGYGPLAVIHFKNPFNWLSEILPRGEHFDYLHTGITPLLTDKKWLPYLRTGPMWSISTFRVKHGFDLMRGSYDSPYKITYSGGGWLFALGAEEDLPIKLHPVFFEVAYKITRTYSSAVVDARDPTAVNTISEGESKQNLFGHIVLVSMGITLF